MWNVEILLVTVGILMFVYAFIAIRRVYMLLRRSSTVSTGTIIGCQVLGGLVLLFLCGYCLFLYFLVTEKDLLFEMNLVVSVIFFWGSVFVVMSFRFFHSILRHRLQIEEELRETGTQLIQSRKSEALGRLAGGVAHDFNNVLLIISNYAEISLHYAEGHPELTEALRNLVAGAEQGRGLTRQLLSFCRKQPVEHQLISLADVLNRSRGMLSELIPDNIDLVVASDGPGWVLGAVDQIQLVLINLVLNARDAMPDGGKITISLFYSDSQSHDCTTNGRTLVLEVADTGHGMDADTEGRVFDPYFTTKKGGNGLGMSMVASTVEQHSGQIRVVTQVKEGTRFQIFLPESKQSQDATSATLNELKPRVPSSGDRRTVLVADDEPGIRKLVKRILTEAGHAVLVAQNSEEALSICDSRAGEIGLLLTDFDMPGMSGIELSQRFVQKVPQTPVVLMSGHPPEHLSPGDSQEEAFRFLSKPFLAAELVELVDDVLKKNQERGS